jgi:protein-L-isoaspartate(D-aspartate) O-methyltransferase
MREQDHLLNQILTRYKISDEVKEAYRKCPRHFFIKRAYRIDEIYSDYPLEIYRDKNFISTISQPSFVLMMIDLLKLKKDDRVLELGAGSGWNAALMSCLASLVVSVEIIPSLAKETKENLRNLGYLNVEILEGDAALGCEKFAPFDKGIFTAGATDLPEAFYLQIKEGGLLLFVLKTSSVDLLLLLEKKNGYFDELRRVPCSFVPMKGMSSALPDSELDELLHTKGRIRISRALKKGQKDSVFSVT